MKPIDFPERNVIFAEDQPEYLPLPAFREQKTPFTVVSCWKLTLLERFKVLFSGKMWFSTLTFGGPLQPQSPSVEKPLRSTAPEATECPQIDLDSKDEV